MANVTISEAARLSGKSRKTVQRYISSGKLSATVHGTEKRIDTSELHRVFGDLSMDNVAPVPETDAGQCRTVSMDTAETKVTDTREVDALKIALSAQKETIDVLQRQVVSLEAQVSQVTKLLDYNRPEKSVERVTLPPFWVVCSFVVAIVVAVSAARYFAGYRF